MTNEEKALSIARLKKISESDKYENPFKLEIYERCLEMAQWKEQQIINKAVEWLKSNCTYNDNGVEKCIVNLGFFIDDMKEE